MAASRRTRTLLVSTDPASSLGDVLRARVDSRPRAVARGGRLDAVNLDAASAFEAWLAPRRALLASIALGGTYLDEDDIGRLLRLSLPGIDEVIGLVAIAQLASAGYDEVIVDTAPTGHTLRLLSAPALLERVARLLDTLHGHHREIVSALRGRYSADSADGLIAELDADGASLADMLRDRRRTALWWVTLPEPMALEETADAIASLDAAGLRVGTIVVNRLTKAPSSDCRWCESRRAFEARAMAPLRRRFRGTEMLALHQQATEPRGLAALTRVAGALAKLEGPSATPPPVSTRIVAGIAAAPPVRPSSAIPGAAKWLLFGGKGGVGKSTCAAAFALDLARTDRARRILLLSSDPAHSLSDVFAVRVDDRPRPLAGAPDNLHVREIDAAAALDEFRSTYLDSVDAVFARISRNLAGGDQTGFRQLVDLAPPGIDEVIAIADVAEILAGTEPRYDTIVSDTAPTGHALRLLRTPAVLREWTQALMAILLKYREVVASGPLAALLVQLSKRLRTLEALLRDPDQTRFVIVTRAAALAREESGRLQDGLATLGMSATTVIVNALGGGTCARCRTRLRAERSEVLRLRAGLADSAYAIIGTPAMMPPPHGVEALSAWAGTWRRFH